jgi:long-chain acyl-CoA synthetase
MFRKTPTRDSSGLSERFRALAVTAPEATALIEGDSGRLVSRAELLDRSDRIREELERCGIAPGELVGIQLPNSVDFIASFLAVVERGCSAVPIDRDARESEVAAILHHFAVRALVYRSHATEALPSITVRDVAPPPARETFVPLIKLTSGSTGTPRGILTTEANLVSDCANICETMDIRPDDRNLGAIPFSHSYGFSNLVTPLLAQGTAIVISNDYLPLSILNLSNRFECTVVPGIPMMFEHLAQLPREDGKFLTARIFISAGAPLTPAVSRRFRERFGKQIHSFYGCSECGGIAYDREGSAVEQGRVGTAMANVSLSVDAETGRLLVQSDTVALGYLGGPNEDAARFRPRTFVTDDLARIDGDGSLELVGRVGDLINTAGKKVNPREVESVILQMEGVRQARVFGEAAGARGEVVAAVVVADPDVTRAQVREFCRTQLSSHKVPRIVKFIESIPLDERGKFKRSALASL